MLLCSALICVTAILVGQEGNGPAEVQLRDRRGRRGRKGVQVQGVQQEGGREVAEPLGGVEGVRPHQLLLG